jgi:hypothetical protein
MKPYTRSTKMTTITTPNVQPDTAAPDTEPLNLYKLGMLFTVRCRYWSCRAGNDADELDLTPDRIDARAIASFGTKDLLDPEKITQTVPGHREEGPARAGEVLASVRRGQRPLRALEPGASRH